MARMFSAASQVYAPGTYGPFKVNGFVKNDTDYLELSFTVEGWPTATPLITGQLRWDTGDGADFTINSPPHMRDGTPLSVVTVRVNVPKDASGKVAVSSGAVTMTALATLQTAVTLQAGAFPAA